MTKTTGKRIGADLATTKLEEAARRWMNSRGADYSDGWRGAYKDLEYGGCASGVVSDLIYYTDTVRFYKRHAADIDALLRETLDGTGCKGPADLFGDKWRTDDPLGRGDLNRNLLAWFGFEEAARAVACRAGWND